MNDAQLVRGVQPPRRLLENFRNLGHGKRTPPREGLAEGFAFQKLHGDVGRAVIGLAGFVNGDDVGVMNAPRGSRFILKAQQEVGVIQQLAAQDFERHRTVAHRDLLGEEDRTHAARAQSADQPETARKTRSELGVDLSHSGKSSARLVAAMYGAERRSEFDLRNAGDRPPAFFRRGGPCGRPRATTRVAPTRLTGLSWMCDSSARLL